MALQLKKLGLVLWEEKVNYDSKQNEYQLRFLEGTITELVPEVSIILEVLFNFLVPEEPWLQKKSTKKQKEISSTFFWWKNVFL